MLVGSWLTYYLFTQGHGDLYKQPHPVVARRIKFGDWVYCCRTAAAIGVYGVLGRLAESAIADETHPIL